MSASLVGSEMCIRDSFWRHRFRACWLPGRSPRGCCGAGCGPGLVFATSSGGRAAPGRGSSCFLFQGSEGGKLQFQEQHFRYPTCGSWFMWCGALSFTGFFYQFGSGCRTRSRPTSFSSTRSGCEKLVFYMCACSVRGSSCSGLPLGRCVCRRFRLGQFCKCIFRINFLTSTLQGRAEVHLDHFTFKLVLPKFKQALWGFHWPPGRRLSQALTCQKIS